MVVDHGGGSGAWLDGIATRLTNEVDESGLWKFVWVVGSCGVGGCYMIARIRMEGSYRLYDNIFLERLWRMVKCEEVFLNDYISVPVYRNGLGKYFEFHNNKKSMSLWSG